MLKMHKTYAAPKPSRSSVQRCYAHVSNTLTDAVPGESARLQVVKWRNSAVYFSRHPAIYTSRVRMRKIHWYQVRMVAAFMCKKLSRLGVLAGAQAGTWRPSTSSLTRTSLSLDLEFMARIATERKTIRCASFSYHYELTHTG